MMRKRMAALVLALLLGPTAACDPVAPSPDDAPAPSPQRELLCPLPKPGRLILQVASPSGVELWRTQGARQLVGVLPFGTLIESNGTTATDFQPVRCGEFTGFARKHGDTGPDDDRWLESVVVPDGFE